MTNEQIVTALGFDDAADEIKQRIIDNTREIVELRVTAILGELMTDEQSDEFQRIVETGNDQAVWDWLRDTIVGADVSEVYEATLQDYIEDFKKRQDDIDVEALLSEE